MLSSLPVNSPMGNAGLQIDPPTAALQHNFQATQLQQAMLQAKLQQLQLLAASQLSSYNDQPGLGYNYVNMQNVPVAL